MADLTAYRVISQSGIYLDKQYDLNALVLLTDAQAKYPLLANQIRLYAVGDDVVPDPTAIDGATETNTTLVITVGGIGRSVTFKDLFTLLPRTAGQVGPQGPQGIQGAQGVQGIQGMNGVVQSIAGVSKPDITLADLNLDKVQNIAPQDLPLSNPTATAIQNAIQQLLINGGTGNPNIDISAVAQAVAQKASNIDLLNHISNQANPHGVTKGQLGLDKVQNIAPVDYPVSTAVQTAISAAQSAAVTTATTAASIDASAKANAAVQAASSLYALNTLNVNVGGIATGGGKLNGDLTITVTKALNTDVATGTDDSKALTSLSIAPALANRLRLDAAQTLSANAVAQGLTNLGISSGLRSFLASADSNSARATLGAVSTAGDTINGPLTLANTLSVAATATFTGQFLTVKSADPSLRLTGTASGQPDLCIRSISNGRFQLCDGAKTVEYLSIGTDGTISTRQVGDLVNYINTQANNAYNNAYNNATGNSNNYTNSVGNGKINAGGLRFVYAGDLGNDWNITGGFGAPYGGYACIVDRATGFGNSSDQLIQVLRWRYLQNYSNNTGWITVGAAS